MNEIREDFSQFSKEYLTTRIEKLELNLIEMQDKIFSFEHLENNKIKLSLEDYDSKLSFKDCLQLLLKKVLRKLNIIA